MKVCLLGATGRLGKEVLKRLVQDEVSTSILVRDVQKIDPQPDFVTVVQGTPSDPVHLESALNGCTAVITTLNISRTSDFPWSKLRAPKTLLSDTMAHLLRLAPPHGIRRSSPSRPGASTKAGRRCPFGSAGPSTTAIFGMATTTTNARRISWRPRSWTGPSSAPLA